MSASTSSLPPRGATDSPSPNSSPPGQKPDKGTPHTAPLQSAIPLDSLPPLQAPQTACMLRATLNVATFNCNGILAKSPSCLDTEPRLHLVTRFMRTTALSVVGLQEPHLKDDIARVRVEQELERHDLSFISALSPQGRGGVALISPKTWTFVRGWSLSPRVMHVTLRDDQGFDQSFMVAHFHHDPTLRKKQW